MSPFYLRVHKKLTADGDKVRLEISHALNLADRS